MYDIVRYTPDLKEEVLRLQTHLWDPDPAVNRAYLEWKYERNPYMAAPMIHLALSDGHVVAMRGIFGACWQAGHPARTFAVPCAGDLVAAPEHRNRGLPALIIEAALRDLDGSGQPFVFNLSASLATQLASLRAGWRSLGPLEDWRRRAPVEAPPRGLRGHARRLPYVWRFVAPAAPLQAFHALDRNAARQRSAPHRAVAVEAAPRPEAMAALVARLPGDARIRHVRDSRYFAWRFGNPLSRYRFLYWTGAALEGYLVLQTAARRPAGVVSVLDWEAPDPEVRAALLHAALAWGRFAEVAIWADSLPPESRAVLREAGFVLVPRAASLGQAHRMQVPRPTVLVRALGPAAAAREWTLSGLSVLDLAAWDLRMLYSDTF